MEAVTTILLERRRDHGGLKQMVTFSLVGHAALVATIILMPAQWWRSAVPAERTVMTISLGGAPGPRAGGMTMIGGRPIQTAVPLPEAKRPEPIRPAAAKQPEMTMPASDAKQKAAAKTPVKTAPEDAKGRTPTRGAEERPGSAVAETGARGQGFGLSTGGGGGGGYLDVSDFCCPEYLQTMLRYIDRNWSRMQPVTGETLMKFTIIRNGQIRDIEVERSSGFTALDLTAERSLFLTQQVPPLPAAFNQDRLTIHLWFRYKR